MSDFLKGTFDINTEDTQEYNDLEAAYFAEELGINTSEILSTLAKDPNKEPAKLFGTYIAEDPQSYVWIEKHRTFLRAHALDRLNEDVGCMDLSIEPKAFFCETINQETYTGLFALAINPEEAKAKVEEKIKSAI